MRKLIFSVAFTISHFGLFCADGAESVSPSEMIVVGGGIIGALESYYAHIEAVKQGYKIPVTVYEKGPSFEETDYSTNTAYNIFPSFTIDEILSVVPRGSELVEKLGILFSQPGGIRVDDVTGVNDSEAALEFKQAVELYGQDEFHEDRTETLLRLGKMSMDAWQDLYDHGDEELKKILMESNYNPCRATAKAALHDGYRIDLIYDMEHAIRHAERMLSTYQQLGYEDCAILTPEEVMARDPFLSDFCIEHSQKNKNDQLCWNDDSVALWRPGGCIDARTFLPQFYSYLKNLMGTYTNEAGETKDCFNLEFHKQVIGVEFSEDLNPRVIGLQFSDGTNCKAANCSYVFCPGEAVGTLQKLGFQEPAYAGFAGSSLWLNIPLNSEQQTCYQKFSHCMEVHKVGIVLAWQARSKGDEISIGVAGTKAFYGDRRPQLGEEFANNRQLVQLNMINEVLPEFVSLAYGYDTKAKQLIASDLAELQQKGILGRWVGTRAVAYDGFPTLGLLYHENQLVPNARCTTHLGSGGASFGPASVFVSRQAEKMVQEPFIGKVLHYADSRRCP